MLSARYFDRIAKTIFNGLLMYTVQSESEVTGQIFITYVVLTARLLLTHSVQ